MTDTLYAGAMAGFCSCLALQPLDLIKTRLQEQSHRVDFNRFLLFSQQIYYKDGLRGFWRGLTPTLIRNVPGTALYFMTLHRIRDVCSNNVIAGALARVSVGFMMMPVTVLKVRQESRLYAGPIYRTLRHVWRTEGVVGFFRGFGATALRDAPHAGIYVATYERTKSVIGMIMGDTGKTKALWINATSGLVAGCVATTLTHPFDLIKTRVQLDRVRYTNILRAAIKILREEGVMGMWSGLLPRVIRKTLGSAITWTVYEEFRRNKIV